MASAPVFGAESDRGNESCVRVCVLCGLVGLEVGKTTAAVMCSRFGMCGRALEGLEGVVG